MNITATTPNFNSYRYSNVKNNVVKNNCSETKVNQDNFAFKGVNSEQAVKLFLSGLGATAAGVILTTKPNTGTVTVNGKAVSAQEAKVYKEMLNNFINIVKSQEIVSSKTHYEDIEDQYGGVHGQREHISYYNKSGQKVKERIDYNTPIDEYTIEDYPFYGKYYEPANSREGTAKFSIHTDNKYYKFSSKNGKIDVTVSKRY